MDGGAWGLSPCPRSWAPRSPGSCQRADPTAPQPAPHCKGVCPAAEAPALILLGLFGLGECLGIASPAQTLTLLVEPWSAMC